MGVVRAPLRIEIMAMDLAARIYEVTEGLPASERYGLTRELRRSAVSVGSNIAEGRGRRTGVEFGRFIDMALGSARELHFQVRLASRLELFEADVAADLEAACNELTAGMLALRRHLTLRSQP